VTAKPASADLQKQLKTLSGMGVVGNLSDGSLLERIVHERDEAAQAAFTVLVERHGPMVLGVCRHAVGNSHDADDAFQATFIRAEHLQIPDRRRKGGTVQSRSPIARKQGVAGP
jgi:Sigma-70 region 2